MAQLALMLSLALGMMAWLRVYVIYGGDSTAATAIAVSCCAIVFIAVRYSLSTCVDIAVSMFVRACVCVCV
eukprot:COSAG01_NODE_425_length_17240_cov_29.899306_14_plen_71_part_00